MVKDLVNNKKEFLNLIKEMGFKNLEDWNNKVGVEFEFLKGKKFELINNRVYID